MLGRLALLLTGLVMAVLGGALFAAPAAAAADDPVECEVYNSDGECIIYADPGSGDDGAGGGGDDPPSGGGGGDGGSQSCVSMSGVEIPCSGPLGTWSELAMCYVDVADPQPDPTDSDNEGEEGQLLYRCQLAPQDSGAGRTSTWTFWAESDPNDGPDPADVAQQAVAAMNLTAGQIGTTPPEGTRGLIGLPTWLWVINPGESTTGPITRTASSGGISVSATATLDSIVYDMGDGSTVTCAGQAAPGTPYTESAGDSASPTCGHTYASTGQYTISATNYWTVEWSGGGQTGTIPMELTGSVDREIGEVQSVVTGG